MKHESPGGRRLEPQETVNLMRSLTLLEADVSSVADRVAQARPIAAGDSAVCIIDITCCIIDCSRCRADDRDIYVNPANQMRGFVFKLPDQAQSPDAPVYLVPELDAPTAFRMGHGSLRVPGDAVEARVLGLAGEILNPKTLAAQGIAATAPVIALSPTKALKDKSGRKGGGQ
jgi:hypothetical protein